MARGANLAGFSNGVAQRAFSTMSLKYADAESTEAGYRVEVPFHSQRLKFEVTADDTLQEFKSKLISGDDTISDVEFHTVDAGINSNQISLSEPLKHFTDMPFLIRLNKTTNYVVSLGKKNWSSSTSKDNDVFGADEQSFFKYGQSIGIPVKNSEVLASFIDEVYNSISKQSTSKKDIENHIFNSLNSFRSFSQNKWGTNRISELKSILDKKEKELISLHKEKVKLDKRALRRANMILYSGGIVLFSQFSFIMGGTYLYFCWDVMEPMAYLMMTSNLTVAFGYYWWNSSELDYQPLQGKFKSSIARRIYRKSRFNYFKFVDLKEEVIQLRKMISSS